MASTSTLKNCQNEEEEESETVISEEPIPGFESVDQFTQQTLRSVLQATKSSNELPAGGDDFDYYSSFDSFRNVMDVEGRRLLQLMKRILSHQGVKGSIAHEEHIDAEDTFDVLADANDHILENVGGNLDEASGVKKKEQTLVIASIKAQPNQPASWNRKSGNSAGKGYRLLSAHNIKRPQLKFKVKVDNSNKPFVPIIRTKPNALKPLAESLAIPVSQNVDDPKFVYPHPYQFELAQFSPLAEQLEKVESQIPGPASLTPAVLIETTSELAEMMSYLKTVNELAVDLEHHSYRTFQGFTCLMQISTRDRDYLIDTLELRSDLYLLNEVFTDPTIVKVFHGADSDVEWLQRDFGLYVVNMFDTGQAARVLHYSRFSLAYLLENLCHVTADKQYQLADWRIRPLPSELVKYAQEDTHYLLHIYDLMKNELLEKGNEQKNLLMSVIHRSKQICDKVYKKCILTEDSYLDLYHQSKKVFNSQQVHCLKKLFEWRDKTARLEDESTGYVLPKHMLLQISDILPRERQGVMACCNPTPPLVRQCVNEIHNLVLEAREVPLVKVKKRQSIQPSSYQHPKFQTNFIFDCPHDRSHSGTSVWEKKGQTTLLDTSLVSESSKLFKTCSTSTIPVKTSPLLSAFSWKPEVLLTESARKAKEIRESFRSPFEMFLPRIPSGGRESKTNTSTEEQSQQQQEAVSWKLMEHTTTEPVVKKTEKLDARPDQPILTKEEEDTVVPLSHQFTNPKKRKKSKESVMLPITEVEVPQPKKGKLEMSTESFKPYDYTQANMNIFDGQSKKDKKKYDPDGALRSMKEHKVYKTKLPSGTGKKSYTFGKGGNSSSTQSWPKR